MAGLPSCLKPLVYVIAKFVVCGAGLANPSSSVLGGGVSPTAGRGVTLRCRIGLDRTEPPHARQHESVREPGKKIITYVTGAFYFFVTCIHSMVHTM